MAIGALFAVPELQAEGPARFLGRQGNYVQLAFLGSGARMTVEASMVVRYALLPGTSVDTDEGDDREIAAVAPSLDRASGLIHYTDTEGEALREDAVMLVHPATDPVHQLRTAAFHEMRPRIGRSGKPIAPDPWGPQTWCARQDLLRWADHGWSNTGGVVGLAGARIIPLPHQIHTARTVLADRKVRYLLADEVGLGKTVEAGLVMQSLLAMNPKLRVLVICPGALIGQWFLECYVKFGGRQLLMLDGERLNGYEGNPWEQQGVIASAAAIEHLEGREALRFATSRWDLVIVDECHRMRPGGLLYNRVASLAKNTPNMLLLSATPPRHHPDAELALLHLLQPDAYPLDDIDGFARKRSVMDRIAKLASTIEEDQSAGKLAKQWQSLAKDDAELKRLLAEAVDDADACAAFSAYVGEHYRLDRRVIRHRRRELAALGGDGVPAVSLATRVCKWVHYKLDAAETAVRDALAHYRSTLLAAHGAEPRLVHWLLTCEQAAWAHPSVLDRLLAMRAMVLEDPEAVADYRARAREGEELSAVLRTDLSEAEANTHIAVSASCHADPDVEDDLLIPLREAVAKWVKRIPARFKTLADRLDAFWTENPDEKVLIFTAQSIAVSEIADYMERKFGSDAVATFGAHLDPEEREAETRRFRDKLSCRILVSDALGGEGRNFQFVSVVVHHDLPWSLAAVEQRVGRVDRIGRDGEVPSWVLVPADEYAVDRCWADILHEGTQVFEASASELEYAADAIGAQAAEALASGGAEGLRAALPELADMAAAERSDDDEQLGALRDADAADARSLAATVSAEKTPYGACCRWLIGMGGSVRRDEDLPRPFQLKGRSAEEASAGVFDRATALAREDLRFFARGHDLIDRLINDAQDAHWCSATAWRRAPRGGIKNWEGLRVDFQLAHDLMPVVAAGLPLEALRRVFTAAPPRRFTRFIGVDGTIVEDEATLNVLRPIFDAKLGDNCISPGQSRETWMRPLLSGKHQQVFDWQQRIDTAAAAAEALCPQLLTAAMEQAQPALEAYLQRDLTLAESQARLAAKRLGKTHADTKRLAQEAEDEAEQAAVLRSALSGAQIDIAGVAYIIVA